MIYRFMEDESHFIATFIRCARKIQKGMVIIMKGDLHCHSKLSDGSQGIEDIIAMSKKMGLDFVAITDHDTMSSHSRSKIVGDRYGVQVIPAVEFSAYDYKRNRRAHILCYLPLKPDRLEAICIKICEARKKSGNEMAKRVMRLFPITPESITKYSASSKSVYKQHIMHALMDAGFSTGIYGGLYDMLFSPTNGSCYVETEYPEVREVIDLIRSAGGIAVFAHPAIYDSFDLVKELIDEQRLDGIEVWHGKATQDDTKFLSDLCDKHGLIKTGGSDFHGLYNSRPAHIGKCTTPIESINAIFALSEIRKQNI